MKDLITALKIASGLSEPANPFAAIHPDGKIGLGDAINIIKTIANP